MYVFGYDKGAYSIHDLTIDDLVGIYKDTSNNQLKTKIKDHLIRDVKMSQLEDSSCVTPLEFVNLILGDS